MCGAGRAGKRERRSLPQVVVVDLGDGRAEPVAEVVLRRADVMALALQRRRLREVQLDGEDRDEAQGHVELYAAASAPDGSSSDVRSTSRVSKTSNTSPS